MTILAALGLLWLGTMFGFFTCACLTASKMGERKVDLSSVDGEACEKRLGQRSDRADEPRANYNADPAVIARARAARSAKQEDQ